MTQERELPLQDTELIRLPTDIRRDIAERVKNNLFIFAKSILGYTDITESCHGPLCTFLDENPSTYKLVLMPRGHFKTSIATISRVMQKVTQNPNSRILIANETSTNAGRFLNAIKQHAESNKRFRALFSDIIPKQKTRWSNEELQFEREWHGPEPTIDSIGMTGAMTSRHFTHITFDDVISEEASRSDAVMHDVQGRIDKVISLMVDPNTNTFDLIGTRWSFNDVYAQMMSGYGPKLVRFIRGAVENGEPIFPERFSLETLAQTRSNMGDYMYSCLYQNNPRNEALQDFNLKDIRWWRWNSKEDAVVLYDREGAIAQVIPYTDLDVTTTVDLAVAESADSDRNAVVTTGVTRDGRVIVLEAWAQRCNPLELIQQLFITAARYHPRSLGIEGVAYQKAFKYFLTAECEARGVWLPIREIKAIGKKELRIRGLQPIAATSKLYLHPTQHILRDEMSDFPLGAHDDCLDALAMQLQLWPDTVNEERWQRYKDAEKRALRTITGYNQTTTDPGDDFDEIIPSVEWTDSTFGSH